MWVCSSNRETSQFDPLPGLGEIDWNLPTNNTQWEIPLDHPLYIYSYKYACGQRTLKARKEEKKGNRPRPSQHPVGDPPRYIYINTYKYTHVFTDFQNPRSSSLFSMASLSGLRRRADRISQHRKQKKTWRTRVPEEIGTKVRIYSLWWLVLCIDDDLTEGAASAVGCNMQQLCDCSQAKVRFK